MQSNQEEQVTYTLYENLPQLQGTLEQLKGKIFTGVSAPETEWKQLFESLTLLRSLSKHAPEVYIGQVLPQVVKNVVAIAEGLRSKLSKQALTLLYETVKYNNLQAIDQPTLNVLIESLFKMSNSEKKFIKTEALKSIIQLQTIKNNNIFFQISLMTLSNIVFISELAITTIKNRLENQMINLDTTVNWKNFIKLVVGNLNAGRAVLTKTAKEILVMIKNAFGEEVFKEQIIAGLKEQEIKQALGATVEKEVKAKGNFKDFIKNKKEI